MKMHSLFTAALAPTLALAFCAEALPDLSGRGAGRMLRPERVAGARLVGRKVMLVTPWMGYGGSGGDANWVPAYDSYEGDDTGLPIGGEDCGDGSFAPDTRWLYTGAPTNSLITSDMTPDAKFGGARSERTNFAWQWDHDGSCKVALFTAEAFGACGTFDMDQVYDGVVYDFGFQPAAAGYYFADNDLTANGLFHQLPAATGAFHMELGEDDGFGGFRVTLQACQPMMWGTGEDGGPDGGAGTNGPLEFQDIYSGDGVIDADADCVDLSGAVPCPTTLATMVKFWVDDQGGNECYADCDGDTTLSFFDFLCFTNAFNAGDMYADCDGDQVLSFFDFLCFTNEFNAGC
jgi:hypothetical protein